VSSARNGQTFHDQRLGIELAVDGLLEQFAKLSGVDVRQRQGGLVQSCAASPRVELLGGDVDGLCASDERRVANVAAGTIDFRMTSIFRFPRRGTHIAVTPDHGRLAASIEPSARR
jgi:hypothetical protein